MQDGKKLIRGRLCLIFLIGIVNIAQAQKSVFIISKHHIPSQAQAYRIDGNEVSLQADVDISTYNQGAGAVGPAGRNNFGQHFFKRGDR